LPKSGSNNGESKPWWVVLQVDKNATLLEIKEAYRALARKHHPDVNGNGDQMATINRAWEEAQRERSL
jgi:curved DNA-binding protein CbpA